MKSYELRIIEGHFDVLIATFELIGDLKHYVGAFPRVGYYIVVVETKRHTEPIDAIDYLIEHRND